MTDQAQKPPDYEPALRAIPMPHDANQSGDIFGGWVLSQMDLAGGSIAARRVKGRCATVAITAMTFHQPIKVTEGLFTFVALGPDRKPRPVPPEE